MKRPQISIRSLLWITALFAVALGWWIDRQRVEARHSLLIRQIAAVNRIREQTLRKDLNEIKRQLFPSQVK